MLIFLLQSVWLYIKELAGKELEIEIIFKFLIYVSPRIIVLVLPLTILLASIMVFGKFAEDYEFAAMKSTGISLQRAMRSLGVFILALSIVTFFFANNVIPAAEFNFYSLRKNIAKVKPSLAIAEGQFNQIGPLVNIKVGEKTGENGEFLKDVVIHEKKSDKDRYNSRVTISERGEFRSIESSDIVQLILYDANVYNDLETQGRSNNGTRPFIKSTNEKYTLNIDLSEFNNVDFDEESAVAKHNMLPIVQLDSVIDSMKVKKADLYKDFSSNMYERSRIRLLNTNIKVLEDSLYNENNFLKLFPPEKSKSIVQLALNATNSTKQIFQGKKKVIDVAEVNLNKHIIAYYDKFALAFMCIILFFVGAPLGALIKKGGMGLPIVIAVVIFLSYHFIGIFAKNGAEDGSVNPILAAWLSTLIMLPIGVYLTSRATKDRGLLDIDAVLEPLKKRFSNKIIQPINNDSLLDLNSESYISLQSYKDDKLIDLVKNFHLYDTDISHRNSALHILNNRGISEQELKFDGNLINENYQSGLRYQTNYEINSKMAFLFYFLALIPDVGGAILNNNKFPSLGKTLMGIGAIFTIFYIITYIKSIKNLFNFDKLQERNLNARSILLIIIGFPLYFIFYFYYKNKMSKEVSQIK